MKNELQNGDHIFDGFMYRPFESGKDGWINETPNADTILAVQVAESIFSMFDEILRLRKENWELKSKLGLG